MALRLEQGLGYVALGPAEATPALLRSLVAGHRSYLWVTDRARDPPENGGVVLRVTTLSGMTGTVDPKRLGDLRTCAAAFLSGDTAGLVILDCLEYLVLHNGPERVLRALADLHDEITMHGGSLVVLVDERIGNPRLVAWLERELDALPAASGPASETGFLPA